MTKLASRLRGLAIAAARRMPELDRRLQLARRKALAAGPGYPDWREVIAADPGGWEEALRAAASGRRVLVATSIGSHLPAMQMETMLAAALTLRGAKVEVLLCDAVLPGCQICEPRLFPDPKRFVDHGPQRDMCGDCFKPGKCVYEELGLTVRRYSDQLDAEDRALADRIARETPFADIEAFTLDGLKLGEQAKAGALRFFARATLDEERYGEPVLRRYLAAAVLTALSLRKLFAAGGYDVAVFHHGIYVPQGVIGEAARAAGVRVVNWNPAYRRDCFIFSHGDTYHHTLMDEPTAVWETMNFTPELRARTTTYLRSRWEGENDWIKFTADPEFGRDRIVSEVGFDPDRPVIVALTNVMWDAQLHYPANAFPNMVEWLIHTIRHFAARPELQLVIRVHPAEIRGSVPSRQPVADEIAKHFPQLPANVFVVGPDSAVSTYVLCELADSVIIYGTKTGVELTSVGIPVIVAGEAWIRGKGITIDVPSVDAYDAILDTLPVGSRRSPEESERAQRYAHHFFFRRMIPVRQFEQGPGWPPYRFQGKSMAQLAPGADSGLDCICDGILSGTSFIYG